MSRPKPCTCMIAHVVRQLSTDRWLIGWSRMPPSMDTFVSPFVVLGVFVTAQGFAVYAGDLLRRKMRPVKEEERADFDIIRAAALTLLALIIGFSFAMAVTRYDQRKNFEEAEANAIGTEYVRVDFLPVEDAAQVRELLRRYVDQRVAFYLARDEGQVLSHPLIF
jgi:hypothetical protein